MIQVTRASDVWSSSTRLLALLLKELHIGGSYLETGVSAFHLGFSFAFVGESTSDTPTQFFWSICFDVKARTAVIHASSGAHPYTALDVAIRKCPACFYFCFPLLSCLFSHKSEQREHVN